jgi:hypothetical protein
MNDLIIIGHDETKLKQAKRDATSPSFIKPGTGGKTVCYRDGRVVGPIGGELLRVALASGARIISEEPVQTFKRQTDTNTGLNIE